MPKKSQPKEEWIEVVVTFKCPKGHEVPIQFTYIKSRGSTRELQDRPFFPRCSQCGWTAKLSGRDAGSIRPAALNRGIR
jgi:hypothetical protein